MSSTGERNLFSGERGAPLQPIKISNNFQSLRLPPNPEITDNFAEEA